RPREAVVFSMIEVRLLMVLSKRFWMAPRSARWASMLAMALSMMATDCWALLAVVMSALLTLFSVVDAVVAAASNRPVTPAPDRATDLVELICTVPVATMVSARATAAP